MDIEDDGKLGEADILLEYHNDSTLELTATDLSTTVPGDGEDEDMETTPEENQSSEKKPMENLKICIDNEPDPEQAVTFLKIEKDSDVVADDVTTESDGPRIQVTMKSARDKSKSYENKTASAIYETGIDMTSQEARSKRLERAKRFGLEGDEVVNEKALNIDALLESLGFEPGTDLENMEGEEAVRTNVVMLRGVDELSTGDIFEYLRRFPPRKLEWIDDTSCNAVFPDHNECNRALINMSSAIKQKAYSKLARNRLGKSKGDSDNTELIVNPNTMEDDDSLDLMTDIGARTSEKTNTTPENTTGSAAVSAAAGKSLHMDMEDGELSDDSDDDAVHVDEKLLPPGRWRIATPCEKTKKTIFMRYATNADVKLRGAESKSDYYRRHGNPNYGGLPGLISRSKKQRFRKQKDHQIQKEAEEAVSAGREKVTYDADDLFGETYEEPGEKTNSRSRAGDERLAQDPESGMDGILKARKRKHNTGRDTDIKEEIDDYMENTVGTKKKKKSPLEIRTSRPEKRLPMGKMAADEEEEKISSIRAHTAAVLADMDVRGRLEQRRWQKNTAHQYYDDDSGDDDEYESGQYEPPRVKHEPKPDLRSRLSRRNDW